MLCIYVNIMLSNELIAPHPWGAAAVTSWSRGALLLPLGSPVPNPPLLPYTGASITVVPRQLHTGNYTPY